MLQGEESKEKDILLQFPTVYIHNWKNTNDYEVYIGESNNVVQRTKQHYEAGADEEKWQHQLLVNDASLYIIGHEHFNKSMTLDVENRLMLYMMSVERVRKIHNLRGNPQGRYYPDNEMDDIFQMIWKKLRMENKELFPSESAIKDSAVFKASPLHKLTEEQELEPLKCCMLVNHDEQINVYKQIAIKLGLTERYGEVVCKPTSFINRHTVENPIDVAFVDEAHLLLTQGKQSYRGKNQLKDIIERARVTVVMFDENQILTTEQYWESEILKQYRELAKGQNNYFELKNQLRIKSSKEVVSWLDDFTKNRNISKLAKNRGGYDIRVFESPLELENAVKEKAANENHKLSRLIATYDWEYSSKPPTKDRLLKYWEVMIEQWHKPWNRELNRELTKREKKNNESLSWAEQSQTIDEVGSTFTIQGFDLNYAGVILGPSVKYRNGKVIFDPTESWNSKAVQNRTLLDGTKKKFGEELIQHEVRILMTRGVEDIY